MAPPLRWRVAALAALASVLVVGAALGAATVAENSAPTGGGLSGASGPVVRASLTVLANSGGNCSGVGTLTGDVNLSSDGSCTYSGIANLVNIDPRLGPFGSLDHGGLLYRLHPDSPALDGGAGIACFDAYGDPLEGDQRLQSRPQDGNGDGALRCDRGAFEAHPGDLFSDGFETGNASRWSSVSP